jgi:hypothetical protein
MRATDYSTREEVLHGWPVRVTTYAIAGVYHCHVDNVSPGAVIARASHADRDAAQTTALSKAADRLAQTKRAYEEPPVKA